MSFLGSIGIDGFKRLQDISLAVASRGINRELARRESERRGSKLRWFIPEEAAVADALAAIIIPSDDETPGMEEVGVFGPPAIVALDNLVATSSKRQELYSRGLLSFDLWARKAHNCKFAEMSKEDQIKLFELTQEVYEHCTENRSPMSKAWHRIRAIARMKNGWYYAAQLYPQIRDDCFQIFYTNRVSWTWLDYDGPPMDQGYPDLSARS